MRDAAQHYRAVAVGKRSRAAGGFWEELLEDSCEYYSLMHKAEITKTPEPMKPIGPKIKRGRFSPATPSRPSQTTRGRWPGAGPSSLRQSTPTAPE